MDELTRLRQANPHLPIEGLEDSDGAAFRPFGRVLTGYDFSPWSAWVEKNLVIGEGTEYQGSLEGLEQEDLHQDLGRRIFGAMEIQSGCCWGMNSRMNGMEFHKSSEVLGAQTSLVLLLGRRQDIFSGHWDSRLVRAFYVPAGTLLELYATSLHLAPCRVDPAGFRAVIVLPRGTNAPLDQRPTITTGAEESQWLFAVNKWMVCHPQSPQKERGAWAGITGENWEVNPLS